MAVYCCHKNKSFPCINASDWIFLRFCVLFVCFFSKIILAQKTKIAETFGISTIFIGALQGTRPPVLQAYGSHKCSPLKAKNSPPDFFLNALTPRGFEPPESHKKTSSTSDYVLLILARWKGLEPLTFWFVGTLV